MASSAGVICNAGFGTATEALYLGKKLLVIPMKNQYEQHCNAAVLSEMGVSTLKNLKEKQLVKIQHWLKAGKVLKMEYPDQTDQMIKNILSDFEKYKNAAPSVEADDFIDFEYMMMPVIDKS
jgi:UDP-N-acetylglucosamine:LPS N-acetylglucosamine transferase